MRLSLIKVVGLHGLFDHDVPLRLDERITIIHAPNGYGKTILLQMISAFFGGSLAAFRKYEYSRFELHFDTGTSVRITQRYYGGDEPAVRRRYERGYRIDLLGGDTVQSWDPEEKPPDDARAISPIAIERYLPELRRIGPREWATRAGEILSYDEVVERNWIHFPPNGRRAASQPRWLQDVRNALHCRLIETQRLVVQKPPSNRPVDPETSNLSAVKTYSAALAATMRVTLAESATLSQSLDRTFPRRILDRMNESAPHQSEAHVRTKLTELEQKRSRLARADLLDKSDEGSVLSHEVFDAQTLRIMTEYVADTETKLSFFDSLLDRIELFTTILNKKFAFKRLHADRNSGFVLKGTGEKDVDLDSLSSGEQHELILLYNLLFDTRQDTLLLIDEPEISLHIAWQKKFLEDLMRIIKLVGIDVVVATHSPQIIGSNVGLTEQLKAPVNAESAF